MEDAPLLYGDRAQIALDKARPKTLSYIQYDAILTANTLQIASSAQVHALFENRPQLLEPQASLVVHSPFNVGGAYTTHSNITFDQWLKAQMRAGASRSGDAADGGGASPAVLPRGPRDAGQQSPLVLDVQLKPARPQTSIHP